MYKLKYSNGHIYVEIDGLDWLIDTGSPSSFGKITSINMLGKNFELEDSFLDLDVESLSEYVNHNVAGLLGTNILNEFNILFDIKNQIIIFSEDKIELVGEVFNIEEVMGVPVLQTQVDNKEISVMFDTGAQLSYFQKEIIDKEDSLGIVKDFYPGIGYFDTDTAMIDIKLGELNYTLKSGYLPKNMNMGLLMTGTEGIIGNDIMLESVVGYFPNENKLVLELSKK
jgi:hypothetical protein